MSRVSAPDSPGAVGHISFLHGLLRASWTEWILFCCAALAFTVLVRVTLYGRVAVMEPGPKGIVIPGALLVALLAWKVIAGWLIVVGTTTPAATLPTLVAATFVPMFCTLPISSGVLQSETFAREYWIDRSLKVELLLGLPVLVLSLQAGLWIWAHYRLTWRRAGPLLAVLGIGLGLRWAGMGWGLPFAYQPEETSIYLRSAVDLALGGHWNPNYFQNPSLLIYLLGVEFLAVFGLCRLLLFGQTPSDLYMVFRGEQDLFYGLGRLDSVLLGTATVFLVYLIGRRLWNERVGLVAGALLAVNFLHVRNSQYAVNDVPSIFFLALSFFFALHLGDGGRWRHYFLAGLMAGLAASTKYNAGMIVVAVAVAHCLGHKGWRDCFRVVPLEKLALSALGAAGGFVLGTPYSVLAFPTFMSGFLSQLELGQSAWSGQSVEPTALQFVASAIQGSGILAALLALLAAGLLAVRDRRRAALLLAFPLSYFAVMSSMDLFFVRWVVPAMPFVALLAAYGFEVLLHAVPHRRLYWVGTALLVLVLLQPTVFSMRLDWLAHQRDTRQEANEWAERVIPPGSKVAVEAFSLLDQESLAFRATLQQRDIELVWRATMHDLDYYRSNGFDYLAVSSFLYDRAFAGPDEYADRVEFYQQLDRELPLVAVFHPRADGKPAPYALDDLDTPFWHLFAYDRPGPTVKVYRIASY